MAKEFIGKLELQLKKTQLNSLNPILRKLILDDGLDLPRKKIGFGDRPLSDYEIRSLESRTKLYERTKAKIKALCDRYGISPTDYDRADSYVLDILKI